MSQDDITIDLHRGVTKRSHPNGIQVLMYKDDLNSYFNINGHPLKEEFAQEAGFDTLKLGIEKEKQEKLKAARIAIEKEYASVEGDIMSETDGYKVICVDEGKNQYDVSSKDGSKRVNEEPLTLDAASELANSLK